MPHSKLFKDYCKRYLPMEMTFREWENIVIALGEAFRDRILAGELIMLPHDFGSLSLRKKKRLTYFDADGNVKTNAQMNMRETLKLWAADENAHKERRKVYYEGKYIYAVVYSKENIRYLYTNRFGYKSARELNTALKNKLAEGDLECFLM